MPKYLTFELGEENPIEKQKPEIHAVRLKASDFSIFSYW